MFHAQDTIAAADQKEPRALPKPILFLHIPKTAGGSFLSMLQNTFGDNRVRRIHRISEDIQEIVHDIAWTERDKISCLAGHFPMHIFESCIDQFEPFTVLRDPIARLLSLYRFIKLRDPEEMQRLGLSTDFSLRQFMESRHPEIVYQVNNGIVRMLSGDPRLRDPNCREFWSLDGNDLGALHSALANLERIDFGLTEEMGRTLELTRARWAIPYELQEYRENTTNSFGTDYDAADIHRIVTRNSLDLAFVQKAREIFRARTQVPTACASNHGWNPLSVFEPVLNEEIEVGDIPGRRGFHEFESSGLAWLRTNQTAEIHFLVPPGRLSMKLRLYCVLPTYPVDDVVVAVNECELRHTHRLTDKQWWCLETQSFEATDGINKIAIRAPLFVPLDTLDSKTKDHRSLGVALGRVAFRST